MITYKNITELLFIQWISGEPESGHPCDMKKFLTFAKSVLQYSASSWLNYDYFEKRILSYLPNFNFEKIKKHFDLFAILKAFKKAQISNKEFDGEGYYQKGVFNNQIYEVKISQKEFEASGINIKSVRERIKSELNDELSK